MTVIAVAVGLRVADLGRRSLWYDEAWAALGCLDGPLDIAHVRATPYLFAALVRGSVALFGRNEVAVRLPAALFSIGAVVVGWQLARRALGPWGGVLATVLLGWLPIPVAYGKELKHYAAELFLALVVASCVRHAAARPPAGGPWFVLTLCAAVGSGLSPLAPLLVAGGFLVLLPCIRRAPVAYTTAATVSGIAALGWLKFVFLPQRALETTIDDYWHLFFLPHGSPVVVAAAAGRSAIDATTYALGTWTPHLADNVVRLPPLPPGPTLLVVVAVMLGALALIRRGEYHLAALSGTWHLLVAAAAFAGAYPYGPARIALVFLAPTVLLLAAAVVGVVSRAPARSRPMVAGLCLLPLVAPLAGTWRENVTTPFEYEELRPVLDDLFAHARTADQIWVSPGATFAFRFYVPSPDGRVSFSPYPSFPDEYRKVLLGALDRGGGRLWLVFSHRGATDVQLARRTLGPVTVLESYARKNASTVLVRRGP